jgi:hypothetical protein
MLFQIAERELPIANIELVLAAGIADQPRARAIAAIGRSGAGGQEQHAIRITMHETWYDCVVILT